MKIAQLTPTTKRGAMAAWAEQQRRIVAGMKAAAMRTAFQAYIRKNPNFKKGH